MRVMFWCSGGMYSMSCFRSVSLSYLRMVLRASEVMISLRWVMMMLFWVVCLRIDVRSWMSFVTRPGSCFGC
jgi:hypothetical protein